MVELKIEKEKCYYNYDGRCMLAIFKKVKGANLMIQHCLSVSGIDSSVGCYRTKEMIETERIEARYW